MFTYRRVYKYRSCTYKNSKSMLALCFSFAFYSILRNLRLVLFYSHSVLSVIFIASTKQFYRFNNLRVKSIFYLIDLKQFFYDLSLTFFENLNL